MQKRHAELREAARSYYTRMRKKLSGGAVAANTYTDTERILLENEKPFNADGCALAQVGSVALVKIVEDR